MDKVYIYKVHASSLSKSNYTKITSIPQQREYYEKKWNHDGSEDYRSKYMYIRSEYLEKMDIPKKMNIRDIFKSRYIKDWMDFNKHFEYNLIHGNKEQYASYIPHVQVSVDQPIKYESVELIDFTETSFESRVISPIFEL